MSATTEDMSTIDDRDGKMGKIKKSFDLVLMLVKVVSYSTYCVSAFGVLMGLIGGMQLSPYLYAISGLSAAGAAAMHMLVKFVQGKVEAINSLLTILSWSRQQVLEARTALADGDNRAQETRKFVENRLRSTLKPLQKQFGLKEEDLLDLIGSVHQGDSRLFMRKLSTVVFKLVKSAIIEVTKKTLYTPLLFSGSGGIISLVLAFMRDSKGGHVGGSAGHYLLLFFSVVCFIMSGGLGFLSAFCVTPIVNASSDYLISFLPELERKYNKAKTSSSGSLSWSSMLPPFLGGTAA